MNSPASAADLARFGLESRPGCLYSIRNCQCAQEYIVECSGLKVPMHKARTDCSFCSGPLTLKTEYETVNFHFPS